MLIHNRDGTHFYLYHVLQEVLVKLSKTKIDVGPVVEVIHPENGEEQDVEANGEERQEQPEDGEIQVGRSL